MPPFTFDQSISNIKFYGKFPGESSSTTQTISTSGSTISLTRGNSYKITATLASGYELALWDPGEHGVIPSGRLVLNTGESGDTNFIPTSDTTLAATGQPTPADTTTTVNMDSNISKISFCNDKYDTYNSSTLSYDCQVVSANGGTVTLKQGATYRTTTTTKQGYEVSSWITTAGTLSNNAGAHNNYTVNGNATLTVSSTTATSTHTVTVNMDSNVSYVVFTNPNWPHKVAIPSANTAELRDNTEYTVTAYTKTGYELASWSTTSGGSLGPSFNPTTYTVTSDATLTVNSQVITPYSVTVNFADLGVSSVTFTNSNEGTTTATTSSPTVTLRRDIPYTITANANVGYDFASWSTTANGILSDVVTNSSTYIVNNTATLTVTSSVIPSYAVTVNLDEHVSSVSFYNADYGTTDTITNQNVGTSGTTGTVSLRRDAVYTVSSSYENDYKTRTWTTTANGTLSSATTAATTYTVVGTATLSLTSQECIALLDTGQVINAKMKTLAEGTAKTYSDSSSKIKSLQMSNTLPLNFTSADGNTISSSESDYPIYIYFDNANDAGIMYFYTEARSLYMNPDSSVAFKNNRQLADISALSVWNTSKVVNMWAMFSDAESLANINPISGWDIKNVSKMGSLFGRTGSGATNNNKIANIDALSNWDTSNVTDMSYMFASATSLTNIDGASNWDTSSVIYMTGMFSDATALADIDGLVNWDTGNVTDMSYMFNNAYALTNIDGASGWDTGSVTSMNHMFYGARALTNIDGASGWDTGSMTDMSFMFFGASALTNIDGASKWDTSNVTNMSHMFYGARALTDIDALSSWDTGNVTNMSYMFYSADTLTNIDGASGWKTGSVTNMSYMFSGASALTNIDGASNWDTSNVIDMSRMFRGTSSSINGFAINNWDISNVKATAGESTSSDNQFYCMFGSGSSYYESACSSTYSNHPEFTKRSGTWNSNGTFIPNDTTSGLTTVTATIIFDQNISSISLDSQTISTSGSTISLTRGNSYKITATLASGYELALWDPGEHGVIPSGRLILNTGENGNTYFYPTSDTTLIATSQLIPADTTTTVNMDSNISKVSFCNDKYNTYNSSTSKYDCQVVSANGGTVTLKQGATYRTVATTKQGYEVSSWTTTAGTLSNNAGPHNNYTVNGNATLTVSSITTTSTHTITANMDSNVSYVVFTNPNWPHKVAIHSANTTELRDNTQYTATAYNKLGYEVASWSTTSGGSLGSTTTNPTTYTVTGDATLTVNSQAIPSYSVTVTMDSNISSISFRNIDYGSQTVSTSGDTVLLRRGVEYTITANHGIGFRLTSWTAGTNSTIGSVSSNPTTFTVTGASTLQATSDYQTQPLSTCSTAVPGITYMQEITDQNKTTVLNSMTENAQYHLLDRRDGTPYCVSKIETVDSSNNTQTALWMTQNLRITGTISATDSNFTGSDINISQCDLDSTVGTCAESSNRNSNSISMTHDSGNTTNGVWYNYAAATAKQITGSSNTTLATEDICPAGWSLPNYDSTKVARSTNSLIGTTYIATFSPVTGGYYSSGSLGSTGSGYWWSTTAYDSSGRYHLSYNGSSLSNTISYNRSVGGYIRCVRK